MKVNDAKRLVKNIAEKQVRVSLLFVGQMGIGKSQIVKQAAEELNIGFIDLRLSQQEPGDLIGIPFRDGNETRHAKPEWWPEPNTRGILFLDEINRAPTDVRQSVFQLVLDGHLHTHLLPPGWVVVSAVNPDNSNYQVESLDKAMVRRFCALVLEPDVESWLAWAHGAGKVRKEITGFIAAQKQALFRKEEVSIATEESPDGWTMLGRLLDAEVIPKDLEYEVFAGLVGKENATAFRRYLDSNFSRPVSGEDLLNNYDKVRAKLEKQKNDEMYATVTDLVALCESLKKPKKEQVANLILFIKNEAVSQEIKVLTVKKLPKDYVHFLIKDSAVTALITKFLDEAAKLDEKK